MKSATINGKEYAVIPMTRRISIDGGGAIVPYFLEKAERIKGTDFYKAIYKNTYCEEVSRIAEFK